MNTKISAHLTWNLVNPKSQNLYRKAKRVCLASFFTYYFPDSQTAHKRMDMYIFDGALYITAALTKRKQYGTYNNNSHYK